MFRHRAIASEPQFGPIRLLKVTIGALAVFLGTAAQAQSTQALPAGHPPIEGTQPSPNALPPGHPPMNAPRTAAGPLPAGHPAEVPADLQATNGGGSAGAEQALPEDFSEVDPSLPSGSIRVEVRDAHDRPLSRVELALGILQQSVAKGESRRTVVRSTDAAGTVQFDHLEVGSGVAYRPHVTVPSPESGGDGATYASTPFQLDLQRGQHVVLHVYPLTHDIDDALLGVQGIVYLELKDEVIQIEELFRLYNLGSITWVPRDVIVALPAGYKAFNTQRGMSDTLFEDAPGRGAKLRGTFSPGQHELTFRYQIPYDGSESVEAVFGAPPHLARMRVIAEAAKSMTLEVKDFPTAISDRNSNGQRLLLTERQLRGGQAPMTRLQVRLDRLPVAGPGRFWAVGLSGLAIAIGVNGIRRRRGDGADAKGLLSAATRDEAEQSRTRLLAEIAALEQAHRSGEVGPKSYAHIRQILIDALARLLPALSAPGASSPPSTVKRSPL